VCDPHRTRGGDKKRRFFGLASKPVAMACQWFGLKPIATVSWFGPQNQGRRFGDLGLKTTAAVSWLGPQNQDRWFGDLGLKITTTVFWFGPQNQVGGGLSVCTSKPMSE
jgi:hypothetical protein